MPDYSPGQVDAMLKAAECKFEKLKEDNELLVQIKKKDEEMLLAKDEEIRQLQKALAQSRKLVSFKVDCIKSLLLHIEFLHTSPSE